MPGLKGFSSQNLKKMRIFFEAYKDQIGSALPNQNGKNTIGSALPNQIDEDFWNIGFTHHYLIISKTKTFEEKQFYIHETRKNAWSSRVLEYHLKSDLYNQKGKLPSNFTRTLPTTNQALTQFKDEYLLDIINIEESEDERILENFLLTCFFTIDKFRPWLQ